jgi:cyclophilin family peptidyl-prolyl cis-trans isomerase
MGTGACEYLNTRDLTGRDVKYVEICFKDYGKMVVLLDATTAPKTVENFINLVNDDFYDGLTLHRIISGFMIQGGDPDATGAGGADKNIYGEFSSNGHVNDISHKRGVISMARSGNNPNSASSQFFICHDDAVHLDGDYAAFGYVVEGISVVDDIVNGTMAKCMEYYGSYFYYWLYSADGSLTDGRDPIKELQPKIKYIKVLDSWGN